MRASERKRKSEAVRRTDKQTLMLMHQKKERKNERARERKSKEGKEEKRQEGGKVGRKHWGTD